MRLYTRATMSDINVTFAGLPLASPLIIESEADQLDLSVIQECQDAGAGAIVFPVLNDDLLNREQDPSERLENNRDDQANRDSDRVLRRLNTEEYLERLEATVQATSIPVIAALQCTRRNQWFTLAQQMKDAGAQAIEIRPFIPERARTQRSDVIEKSILRTTSYVADRLESPIICRIPTFLHGVQAFVHALGDAGAKAVLIDPPPTLLGVDKESIQLTEHASDEHVAYAAFLTSLTAARTLYRRVSSHLALCLPKNASSSLVVSLIAGATVSTLPVHGTDPEEARKAVRRYIQQLERWMSAHSMGNLFDFRGSLSESRVTSSLEN